MEEKKKRFEFESKASAVGIALVFVVALGWVHYVVGATVNAPKDVCTTTKVGNKTDEQCYSGLSHVLMAMWALLSLGVGAFCLSRVRYGG